VFAETALSRVAVSQPIEPSGFSHGSLRARCGRYVSGRSGWCLAYGHMPRWQWHQVTGDSDEMSCVAPPVYGSRKFHEFGERPASSSVTLHVQPEGCRFVESVA
jgi:hypothetical protein